MSVIGGLLDAGRAAAPAAVGAGLLAAPEDAEAIFLRATPERLARAQMRGDFLPEKATPENLAKAEEMFASNVSPRKIYEETGFFKGADGFTRFEVPDDQTRFSGLLPRQANVTQLTSDVLDSDYGSLLADNIGLPQVVRDERLLPLGFLGSYSPQKNVITLEDSLVQNTDLAKGVLLHELQHAAQTSQGMAGGSNPGGIQNQMLRELKTPSDLPKAAYEFDEALEGLKALAKFERVKRYEKLARDENLTGKQRLLFGNSEWYQYGSKITRNLGSMPKRHRPKPERNAWLSAAWQALADINKSQIAGGDYDYLNRVLNAKRGEALSFVGEERNPVELNRIDLDTLKRARSRVERYLDKRRDKAFEKANIDRRRKEIREADPRDLYKRTAGEVEARNVQTRLAMTPEERYASYPPDTEDVLRGNQVFADNPMQRAQMGFASPAALIPIAAASGGGLLAANQFGDMPTVSESTPTQRFTEGVVGGADFLANAASGLVEPLLTSSLVLQQAVTPVSTPQLLQTQQQARSAFDYQPRTEIGRQASESAQRAVSGALAAPMSAAGSLLEPLEPIADMVRQLPQRAQLVGESILDIF